MQNQPLDKLHAFNDPAFTGKGEAIKVSDMSRTGECVSRQSPLHLMREQNPHHRVPPSFQLANVRSQAQIMERI
ncbi:MAG: hypothetical protein HZA95_01100 [Candidatus Vogelbacteria bacterium]|nr:hypothetical protein [Candidatus Vogelbacteria bacterium]